MSPCETYRFPAFDALRFASAFARTNFGERVGQPIPRAKSPPAEIVNNGVWMPNRARPFANLTILPAAHPRWAMTQADTVIIRAALDGETSIYRDIEIEPS